MHCDCSCSNKRKTKVGTFLMIDLWWWKGKKIHVGKRGNQAEFIIFLKLAFIISWYLDSVSKWLVWYVLLVPTKVLVENVVQTWMGGFPIWIDPSWFGFGLAPDLRVFRFQVFFKHCAARGEVKPPQKRAANTKFGLDQMHGCHRKQLIQNYDLDSGLLDSVAPRKVESPRNQP